MEGKAKTIWGDSEVDGGVEERAGNVPGHMGPLGALPLPRLIGQEFGVLRVFRRGNLGGEPR